MPVDRTVSFTAERRDSMFLCQQWLDGAGSDGVTFELVVGAGLGSPLMRLTVHHNNHSTSEVVNIGAGVEAWVTRLVAELDAESAP